MFVFLLVFLACNSCVIKSDTGSDAKDTSTD